MKTIKAYDLRAQYHSVHVQEPKHKIKPLEFCPWCGDALDHVPDIEPDSDRTWMWHYRCYECGIDIQCLARETG